MKKQSYHSPTLKVLALNARNVIVTSRIELPKIEF